MLGTGSKTTSTEKACGACTYFSLDHLGTFRLLTNAAQQPLGVYHYFGFGEAIGGNEPNEVMQFTGHERDSNTSSGSEDDLDYMHARYCTPNLGRFLSVDPALASAQPTAPQSWNRYAYTTNNPLTFVDPTGLAQVCAGDGDARACVSVDGNGDGDTSDDDLPEDQIQALSEAY